MMCETGPWLHLIALDLSMENTYLYTLNLSFYITGPTCDEETCNGTCWDAGPENCQISEYIDLLVM